MEYIEFIDIYCGTSCFWMVGSPNIYNMEINWVINIHSSKKDYIPITTHNDLLNMKNKSICIETVHECEIEKITNYIVQYNRNQQIEDILNE